MAATRDAGPTESSDPLTVTTTALLALVAVLGLLFCLGYAVWWLITFWAPL